MKTFEIHLNSCNPLFCIYLKLWLWLDKSEVTHNSQMILLRHNPNRWRHVISARTMHVSNILCKRQPKKKSDTGLTWLDRSCVCVFWHELIAEECGGKLRQEVSIRTLRLAQSIYTQTHTEVFNLTFFTHSLHPCVINLEPTWLIQSELQVWPQRLSKDLAWKQVREVVLCQDFQLVQNEPWWDGGFGCLQSFVPTFRFISAVGLWKRFHKSAAGANTAIRCPLHLCLRKVACVQSSARNTSDPTKW